jgi:electron transfer flavoprotein beta subunit
VRVFVTVKHVPDTTEVRFDADGGLLVRQAPTKINDYDRNALEAAAQLREHAGAEVIIGCVGPPEAAKTLKEAAAFGADHAVLVSGPWVQTLDSAGSAELLAALARSEGPFDLVLSGDVSEDGYDGLVPGMLGAALDMPFIRGVSALSIQEGVAEVTRIADDSEETLRVTLPAALSVTRLLNVPRVITTMQVMKVSTSRIRIVAAGDVGVDEATLTLESLAVRALRVRPATQTRSNEMLHGDPEQMVADLVSRLDDLGVLA